MISISFCILKNTNKGLQATSVETVSSSSTGNDLPEINTNNWQVYRNEEWGFAMRYPKDWNAFFHTKDAEFFSDVDKKYFTMSVQNLPKGTTASCGGVTEIPDGMTVDVIVTQNGIFQSNRTAQYQDIISDCEKQSEDGKCDTSIRNFNGQEFFVVDSWHTLCGYPTAYTFTDNYQYTISPIWSNQVSLNKYDYYSKVFYKFLENFKVN